MKRRLMIAAAVCVALGLTACGRVSDEDIYRAQRDDTTMFMKVYDELGGYVMVDKDTGVMYWMATSSGAFGYLTALVNPDGTPRIWGK